ncbi:hypothetical protein E2C01_057382 [Portunus trituberculatus]|uniref:Uncharacterized protein n=1 Tax=Portunus trituberculatus TaxID=210409 RepID=A0A5B7H0C2_PORTR|nr:hypothetical protein [Portunus trituberculatus]
MPTTAWVYRPCSATLGATLLLLGNHLETHLVPPPPTSGSHSTVASLALAQRVERAAASCITRRSRHGTGDPVTPDPSWEHPGSLPPDWHHHQPLTPGEQRYMGRAGARHAAFPLQHVAVLPSAPGQREWAERCQLAAASARENPRARPPIKSRRNATLLSVRLVSTSGGAIVDPYSGGQNMCTLGGVPVGVSCLCDP